MDDGLDPDRLEGLFEIGVDEVSWRKRHNYLTLVSDHRRRRVVWGAEGRDTATLDGFVDELGEQRSAAVTAVSMDMSAGDLEEADVAYLLDRFCSRAQRSGLKPFVTLAKTIRKHRAGILAAVRLGVNNARHEGLNRRVRQIITRAYGFHSSRAALALIMLAIGPIDHVLPHERTGVP
jgi:transposase